MPLRMWTLPPGVRLAAALVTLTFATIAPVPARAAGEATAGGASGVLPSAAPGGDSAPERILETIEAEYVPPDHRFWILPRWSAGGRPEIALALSGGGARGIAHIGVLEAMREDGVEFDAVAGTSAGAMVGALLAAGYDAPEIEMIYKGRDWQAIISGLDARNRVLSETEDIRNAAALASIRRRKGKPLQIGALFEDRLLKRELYRYLLRAQTLSGGDFDALRYRYRGVATDVITGRPVVPSGGDLVTIVRGSSAIPGFWRPVPSGEALLVDGGIVENLPVRTARDLVNGLVVASDVTEGIIQSSDVHGTIDLLNRLVNVMMTRSGEEAMSGSDLVVKPDVFRFSPTDFGGNIDDLISEGRAAYARDRDALWTALEAAAPDHSTVAFDRIEVTGTDWITAGELARRLGRASGSVTRYRVRAELARALNLGPLASGRAELLLRDGRRILSFLFTPSVPVRELTLSGWPSSERRIRAPSVTPDEPFSLEGALHVTRRARQELVDNGRILVHMEDFRWDPETGALRVELSDSPVKKVRTQVEGDVRLTRTSRLFDRFSDQPLDYARLADRLDELLARGAILDWTLSPRMRKDGRVEIQAHLRADSFFEGSFGGGWRGDLGFAGFARAAQSNLTGRGDLVEFEYTGGTDIAQASLRYRTEYTRFFRDLGGEIGFSVHDNDFPVVDADQNLVDGDEEGYRGDNTTLRFLKRFSRGGVVQAGVFYERNRLDSTDLQPAERFARTSALLSFDVDSHDRLLFPTRGSSLRLRAETPLAGQNLWKAEIESDLVASPGSSDRNTLTGSLRAGLSGGAERRPFWYDPGGFRELYGYIPYGAAAPQYATAGLSYRRLLFDLGAVRVYAEAGIDALWTSQFRSDLTGGPGRLGYGASLTAHSDLIGPVTLGAARNDDGARLWFLTVGYPFLRR